MGMRLDQVVPWGRSLAEYVGMFALSERDLTDRSILGCADGPASFNAELTARGGGVVSCDPIYAFGPELIRRRVAETCDTILSQVERTQDEYVWTIIASPTDLRQRRLVAMERFLSDFASPTAPARYISASLPTLPFADATFDLAVCSHLLFLYSDQLSASFHIAAVHELLRVAGEVRIFPLLDLNRRRSAHLDPVIASVRAQGGTAHIQPVDYEFVRGANELLTLRRAPVNQSNQGHRTSDQGPGTVTT